MSGEVERSAPVYNRERLLPNSGPTRVGLVVVRSDGGKAQGAWESDDEGVTVVTVPVEPRLERGAPDPATAPVFVDVTITFRARVG